MHPDTGEPIHPAFRVCAFVPANIPICAGMLMTPPTTANIIFWQFANQSYNAGFNFANRNASSPITTTQLGTAFVAATTGAISIAMGLNKAVSSAKNLSPTLKMVLTRCTPFAAVGLSNVVNLLAMRSGELSTGIPVVDEFDNVLGKSKEAAKSALTQGAVTRAVLPAPVLVLPPLIISQVEKVAPNVVKNPRMKAAMELGIIVGCVWGALPVAIGLFPQKSSISTSKLEKEFQGLKSADGKPITQVYFNKGV
jgi:tricarboxylate carrier